jgi:hypothetical protein
MNQLDYSLGGCGCYTPNSLLVCGAFAAPANPDLGHCHAAHVLITCEAPAVTVNPTPASTSWDVYGQPLFSIP